MLITTSLRWFAAFGSKRKYFPLPPLSHPRRKEKCEKFFVQTHTRTTKRRHVVRLPFTAIPRNIGETRKLAERLLTAMEWKGSRDSWFGNLYRTFMPEYENLKHMNEINQGSTANHDVAGICYLPHHRMLRESSATIKFCVVFNRLQRVRSGESLNTQLLVGVNLLSALADCPLPLAVASICHRGGHQKDVPPNFRASRRP
ncbi:hypothetical protein ACFW04_011795 [Cataglyphis niger]